jgi:hypothetical protein
MKMSNDNVEPSVLYITDGPLRESIIESLGIKQLKEINALIHFIDVIDICHPNSRTHFEKHFLLSPEDLKRHSIFAPQNLQECYKHIHALGLPSHTKVVLLFSLSSIRAILFFKGLKKALPKSQFIIWYPFTMHTKIFFLWTSWPHIKKNIKVLLKSFILRLLKFYIPKVDHIFLVGNGSLSFFQHFINQRTQITYIQSPDITLLHNAGNKKSPLENEYILYLDSSIVDCIDNQILDLKPSIDKEKYYSTLEKFLQSIATISKKEVVIAAHPSSAFFANASGEYKGFKYFKNLTPELSLNASAFLADFPTNTIIFPIFLNRPLILFKSINLLRDYQKNNWHYRDFLLLEARLNKKFINIDKDLDDQLIIEIKNELKNKTSYNSYMHNFCDGPDGKSHEFFEALIKTI